MPKEANRNNVMEEKQKRKLGVSKQAALFKMLAIE